MTSAPGICPPGTPADAECFARTGRGVVPGLGKVSESYTFVVVNETGPACPGGQTLRGSVGRFRVADKGEIELRIDASPECYPVNGVLKGTRPFSVTGGSGLYAGASGAERSITTLSSGRSAAPRALTRGRHARRSGARVRPDGSGLERCAEQGRARAAGAAGGPGAVQGQRPGRRRRLAAGDVQASVGKPVQAREDPRRLLGHRSERQHRGGEIHGHREARRPVGVPATRPLTAGAVSGQLT